METKRSKRSFLLGQPWLTIAVATVVLFSIVVLFATFPYGPGNWLPFSMAVIFTLGTVYLLAVLHAARKEITVRLMNYGNVVTDSDPVPQDREKVTLFGDDGLLKLSVSMRNLYYIESDDNYIKVWYSDTGGEVRQYMLRCRLKTVEESFAGSPLVRCHRKYMVNLTRVDVLTREKDGYYLKLDLPSADPIPVSKTYAETVISRFNSR